MTTITQFTEKLTPWQKECAACCGLIIAIFLAYSNVYSNGYLFDDGLIITRNTLLDSWTTFGKLLRSSTTDGAHIAGGFYRPVQTALYFFVYQIADAQNIPLRLFLFHLLNVSLHTINACLLYTLGRKLNFAPIACFLGCLLWAMHPLHVEAVTYMSSTADTLHVLFILLGLIYLLPDFSAGKFFFAIPIYLLALFSKEVSIVFPALVAVCMYFYCDEGRKPQAYIRTYPLWTVAALYLAWRLTTPGLDGPASYDRIYQMPAYQTMKMYADHFNYRFYTFLATIPAYLQIILWPVGLHMERTFSIFVDFWLWQSMLGAFIVLASLFFIFTTKNEKNKPAAWGLLWFGTAHFPDSGILMGVNSLFLEHWMYLPLSGLLLGLGQTIYLHVTSIGFEKARLATAYLALTIAVALGTATYFQNQVWHDPITFYTHLFKYGVVSARAHNNLAMAYADAHEEDKAIEEFHKAIEIGDTYAETRHNLAVLLMNLPDRTQHIPEAIEQLNRAIEIDPGFYRSYIALSQIYAYLHDSAKADAYRAKAEAILNKFN